MPGEGQYGNEEESQPLTKYLEEDLARRSIGSVTSGSTTSLVLENLRKPGTHLYGAPNGETNPNGLPGVKATDDLEEGAPYPSGSKPVEKRVRLLLWILGASLVGGWLVALAVFALSRGGTGASLRGGAGSLLSRGKQVTLGQVLTGQWRGQSHEISWIEGANGEDGLLLKRGDSHGEGYLVVEDVRTRSGKKNADAHDRKILMLQDSFTVGDERIYPSDVWPSRDLTKVLVISQKESNWRHSYFGRYWIFDVATQTAQPLDPANPNGRIQLASWSPASDAIVFTRDKNMFLRKLSSNQVTQITKDGGMNLFYGVPDWVYEEEVFSGNSGTWWSEDGRFVAFLRTNETLVPEYPIQYFVSRPSGKRPQPGLENYPEVRNIKYPKAGAPNPVVDLQFYDTTTGIVFSVGIDGQFPDLDRLITEVVWAGSSGKVLVRLTNRESDILQIALIDAKFREGKVVRTVDVNSLDHGWFEVSQDTRYIPADPPKGRPHDGYIDTIIHEGYDHLAYFSPLDNPDPVVLTSGPWEVVKAPSAVDLEKNIVYFVATKESPIQRHVYSVKLDGTNLSPVTNTTEEGYYDVSFSKGARFALLSYQGPDVPWQEVISTPSSDVDYVDVIEENEHLADKAAQYDLPVEIYQTVTIDGFTLQVVERRPPHFDPSKKYPVLFHLYGGPGSQTVNKKWTVDFQAYVAATLGYIVVTVDGRGTGFIGRKARCIVRGNIGYYEATDQIETAKIWAKKEYVDPKRIAIWGWSYGGFLTLKTLEMDGGRTFKYGMAVAPVTDWKFYDSIYTERYMHTPQHNPEGYTNASISNMTALQSNVRFFVMHGVADDNVHMQNSLTLLDKLDLAGVENYDVHVFPDSDHSIYFHNANRIVYDLLSTWLINAFNGEWLRLESPVPIDVSSRRR